MKNYHIWVNLALYLVYLYQWIARHMMGEGAPGVWVEVIGLNRIVMARRKLYDDNR